MNPRPWRPVRAADLRRFLTPPALRARCLFRNPLANALPICADTPSCASSSFPATCNLERDS